MRTSELQNRLRFRVSGFTWTGMVIGGVVLNTLLLFSFKLLIPALLLLGLTMWIALSKHDLTVVGV